MTSYPRGYVLRDLSDLSDLLRKGQEVDSKAIDDWITVNAGPLPAETMPDRVADIVLKLIENNERRDQA